MQNGTLDASPLERLLGEVRRLLSAGRRVDARDLLNSRADVEPDNAMGWRAIAGAWQAAGDDDRASTIQLRAIAAALSEPDMVSVAKAMEARDWAGAEHGLRARLKAQPGDTAATAMLGDVLVRTRRFDEAFPLLEQAVSAAPAFRPARQSLAFARYSRGETGAGLKQVDAILAMEPQDFAARDLKAALLVQQGREEDAITLYRAIQADDADRGKSTLIPLGHALKAVGRTDEGVTAYRAAIDAEVSPGEAYWSLANLKSYRFTDGDAEDIARRLVDPATTEPERAPLAFALGKAREDAGEDERAFVAYAEGNRLRRAVLPYDPQEITNLVDRAVALLESGVLSDLAGGCPSPEPIFIVGLPRSGSTLIEQILASHPLVEATRELPYLPRIVQGLDARTSKDSKGRYPEIVTRISPEQRADLGRRYLHQAEPLRRETKPYFIDKLPENFLSIPLIRAILPNARIIDARRHPMATGFSCFKQHFAHHHHFSYDLADIGRYYADYVRFMQAVDDALPGRVHRVVHEALVADPEREIRALLDCLRLPFDAACLVPHEAARTVRTPSAEQVRQPIGSSDTDRWRRFERWLGPLEAALGPTLAAYPAAPGR